MLSGKDCTRLRLGGNAETPGRSRVKISLYCRDWYERADAITVEQDIYHCIDDRSDVTDRSVKLADNESSSRTARSDLPSYSIV
jgi:hypothetical protein